MSKKRKRKQEDIDTNVELPCSFREITQLTNKDLNSLLRHLNLPTKGKRSHKYTLVATTIGIETTDSNEVDPFIQTLNDISSVVDGWTTNLRDVPEVKLDFILKYLLAAHDIDEKFDSASLKSYKALRAYDMWESGHISGFTFHPLPDIENYCALKCLANPSGDTSGTQYNSIVVLNDSGLPIGASCTCVAGLGEACTHIAGLLFGLEDFVSRGYKELPFSESATEKLCKWIVPKGPKVEPRPIKDVSVKKNIPGSNKKEKLFRASNFNPLPLEQTSIDYDALTQLHHTLSLVSPSIPWVRAVAPAIIKKVKPVTDQISTPIIKCLPNVTTFDNPALVPTHEVCVNTNSDPLTLKEKIRLKTDLHDEELACYTAEEKIAIEELTRKQANSVHWHKYRHGIATASNFYRIASHMRTLKKSAPNKTTATLTDTLINGSSFKGNRATRYGQAEEPKAAEAYLHKMRETHEDCSVEECGLFISADFHHLGASPDRIFSCKCHGKRLVEIKCPYTLTDKTRSVQSMDFLEVEETGNLILKRSGNSYYDQIQAQMGVTGIQLCDLVVWSGEKIDIVAVDLDKAYWESLAESVKEFHITYVYPAIVRSIGKCSYQAERRNVQTAVSEQTSRFPCGKCGQILIEDVANDAEASINCECNCKCGLWFHWKCVNFSPDPDLLDVEPAWYCPSCVRNCDVVM